MARHADRLSLEIGQPLECLGIAVGRVGDEARAVVQPTSLISTFLVMYLPHFTLNTMSMMALALMIGVLVDDSIVVLENIHKYLSAVNSGAGGALSGGRDPLQVLAMLQEKEAMDRFEATAGLGLACLLAALAGWPRPARPGLAAEAEARGSIGSDLLPFVLVVSVLFAAMSCFELPWERGRQPLNRFGLSVAAFPGQSVGSSSADRDLGNSGLSAERLARPDRRAA